MSLTQDFSDANYVITRYEPGRVFINHEEYANNLIICPSKLISPWEINSINELNETNLAGLFELQPEIVLLGSGEHLIMPEAKIIASFAQHAIGLESMNTHAACRTYSILVAEGRHVAAALFVNHS